MVFPAMLDFICRWRTVGERWGPIHDEEVFFLVVKCDHFYVQYQPFGLPNIQLSKNGTEQL